MTETHKIVIGNIETNITTPDGFGALVVEAFAAEHKYSSTVMDSDGNESANPQSKAAFTANKIVEYVRAVVSAHRHKVERKKTQELVQSQNDAMGSQIGVSVVEPS